MHICLLGLGTPPDEEVVALRAGLAACACRGGGAARRPYSPVTLTQSSSGVMGSPHSGPSSIGGTSSLDICLWGLLTLLSSGDVLGTAGVDAVLQSLTDATGAWSQPAVRQQQAPYVQYYCMNIIGRLASSKSGQQFRLWLQERAEERGTRQWTGEEGDLGPKGKDGEAGQGCVHSCRSV